VSIDVLRRDFPDADSKDLEAIITWNALVEPGDRIAGQLRSELGDVAALKRLLEQNTSALAGISSEQLRSAFDRWSPRYRDGLAKDVIARAVKGDMKLLVPSDSQWPIALSSLENFGPMLLWYRGNVKHFDSFDRCVGVVGSRTCTSYGQKVTSDLVLALTQERAVAVSGGALGVDSVVHRVALSQNSLTVAVMAGSLDHLYPAGNWQLFEEIAHKGLLISEMTPGSRPTRWRFLQRNRLIAALAEAIVVTEAGWRSGSINTVGHANDLMRRVFAVPGQITSPASAGCNRLIRDQLAELLLDVNDLAEELGWRNPTLDTLVGMGSLELRVIDVLGVREKTFERIQAESGLSQDELRLAIGSLQLTNSINRGVKGGWKRTIQG